MYKKEKTQNKAKTRTLISRHQHLFQDTNTYFQAPTLIVTVSTLIALNNPGGGLDNRPCRNKIENKGGTGSKVMGEKG